MLYTNYSGNVIYESPVDWISSSNCRIGTGNYRCHLNLSLTNKMICVAGMA